MNPVRPSVYQAVIRLLPFKKEKAAYALGCIMGGRVRAVVHQATMVLDLGETIQRQMFLGKYEPEQTGWFRECLEPGDTVIDVGASFGYYTTLGSALVGPSGKVFAFEPSPVAGRVLEEAIRDSGIRNISGWLLRNSTTPKRLLARFLELGFDIRKQTTLQRLPTGKPGETFDLQDIWFRIKGSP